MLSDINNDNRPDLMVTYQWASIGVFINDEGKSLKNHSTTSGIGELWGWWNGICAGDIDNDGDKDIVVTSDRGNNDRKVRFGSNIIWFENKISGRWWVDQ